MTNRVFPPLIAFLCCRSLLALAAFNQHLPLWRAETWSRWDSGNYYAIESRGYECYQGPDPTMPTRRIWLGTTPWFPGYPWLIRSLTPRGVSAGSVGLIVSAVFSFLTLSILWNGFLNQMRSRTRWVALFSAAFFPGHIYYHALFPISMCTCFILLFLWGLQNAKWLIAALSGLTASITYPMGFFLGAVLFLWAVIHHRSLGPHARVVWIVASFPVLGFLITMIWQWMDVGIWGSYFKALEFHRYASGGSWASFWQRLIVPIVYRADEFTKVMVLSQSLVIDTFVVLITWHTYHEGMKRGFSPKLTNAGLLTIYAWAFLLVPHLTNVRVSYYRSESLLIPLTALLSQLPARFQILFLVVFMLLSYPMAILFFQSHLV